MDTEAVFEILVLRSIFKIFPEFAGIIYKYC